MLTLYSSFIGKVHDIIIFVADNRRRMKIIKILAMVTFSGFLVLLPCTITYYLGDQNLISALIA